MRDLSTYPVTRQEILDKRCVDLDALINRAIELLREGDLDAS